ncbi:PIN/TRAM domain-containing protein [Acaryochloris sp. IP29b_bin.137]|uniref:PIN/TRAM domain-containing protein n=1 Tax=Acaryochloris sp. IP29b_bin.137 TaxID=2969217 RepID=UPI002604710C|nr:PIN/TRAM domain-containing protein [Acaryochloris sp. IP29b_bin.137]
MLDLFIILTFIAVGAAVGFRGVDLLPDLLTPTELEGVNIEGLRWVITGFGAFLSFAIGFAAQVSCRRIEKKIKALPTDVLLSRSAGLCLGLLVANLMLAPIFLFPLPREFAFIKPTAAVLGSLIFAFLGLTLADIHGQTILRLINPNSIETILMAEGTLQPSPTKVLDTSCIIDGRIEGLLLTGFLDGQILVPRFILQELQTLADAGNDQKRARGRRGLDILNRLRTEYPDRITIHPADYKDVATVDAKLVRLALDINASMVTNDYNLNKVASVQNIQVLNVNDLAKSLRPIYLPGDSLDLKIIKAGKEPEQGVGYLEDGTMVVVEEARDHIGDEVPVVVTSALQTSAGRMIFARPQTAWA